MPGDDDSSVAAAAAASTAGSRGGDGAGRGADRDGEAPRPSSPAGSEPSGGHSGDSSSSGEEEGGSATQRPGKLSTVWILLGPLPAGLPCLRLLDFGRHRASLYHAAPASVDRHDLLLIPHLRQLAGADVPLLARRAGCCHERVGVRGSQHRGRCRGLRHLHGRWGRGAPYVHPVFCMHTESPTGMSCTAQKSAGRGSPATSAVAELYGSHRLHQRCPCPVC